MYSKSTTAMSPMPKEQLCLMLLREAGELPVTGRLPDGRSIVEKVQM